MLNVRWIIFITRETVKYIIWETDLKTKIFQTNLKPFQVRHEKFLKVWLKLGLKKWSFSSMDIQMFGLVSFFFFNKLYPKYTNFCCFWSAPQTKKKKTVGDHKMSGFQRKIFSLLEWKSFIFSWWEKNLKVRKSMLIRIFNIYL